MKKFQFRLESLLRIRESERDRCRLELAECRRTEEELRRRLSKLRGQRDRLQQECRKAAGPGELDVDWLAEAHCYASTLLEKETELLRRMNALAENIERRRDALVQAERKVQMLEKLRERRRQDDCRERERQDAKSLDEIALLGIGR
jgi:flagellar protein FliJ